ncbi:hypothetical protein PAT01_03540 [Pseudoalteromonas atlantica]|uniref:DUF4440 domain-containing protein n=1 Tax=Pseudoalteromonas atlantica TaxID=288 RepID=A0ABQ0U9H7_PSEAF|nr:MULTISPECIES: hypothetical protein [unclassified Pseudoalteromonas]TMO05139.1 hypothetical protein CWB60_14360 [Pseudoalteromonas sp. S327]TMO20359.1 hypothetical protein CWB59_00875 [Pseudoalteromonas sp. S326]GEK75050.1 hypothetical protein PAT01_03540 [Pseudoalteromonas atlantica]
MKKIAFITLAQSLLLSFTASAVDYSIPIENCKKSVDIVLNQDYELFKQVYAPLSKDMDQSIVKGMLARKHANYTKKQYLGIHNFTIVGTEVLEDAKNSIIKRTQRNALKYGYTDELWVNYTFKTSKVFGKKEDNVTIKGKCKFGQVDGKWLMVNLLRS